MPSPALFLGVTADFCFASLSQHPSISSLVRQCEIVQIRSPYFCQQLTRTKVLGVCILCSFFDSLSLLSSDSMLCVWCNGPIITLSDLSWFLPTTEPLNLKHSDTYAGLLHFSLNLVCIGNVVNDSVRSFSTSYFTHYQTLLLTLKWNAPIFQILFLNGTFVVCFN